MEFQLFFAKEVSTLCTVSTVDLQVIKTCTMLQVIFATWRTVFNNFLG